MRGFLWLFWVLLMLPTLTFAEDKEPEKTAEEKVDKSPSLEERILLVLKYGTSMQVRDTIPKILKLEESEQKVFIPQLRELSNSRDVLLRRKLAEMIGKLKWNDLDLLLASLLQAPEDEVFYAVVIALQKKKIPEALPIIQSEIKSADFTKASNRVPDLLRLYATYQDSSLCEFLYEILKQEDTYQEFQFGILKYFAKVKPVYQPSIDYALEKFKDDEEDLKVRAMAVYILGQQKVSSAAADLRGALDKIDEIADIDERRKYSQLRVNLIRSLTELEDEKVIEILIEMSRDDDELVRLKAVEQLAELNLEKYRELIEYKAKYDPSLKVQEKAKSFIEDKKEEETPIERDDTEPGNS
jgi:HEAT repeat protein